MNIGLVKMQSKLKLFEMFVSIESAITPIDKPATKKDKMNWLYSYGRFACFYCYCWHYLNFSWPFFRLKLAKKLKYVTCLSPKWHRQNQRRNVFSIGHLICIIWNIWFLFPLSWLSKYHSVTSEIIKCFNTKLYSVAQW